MTLVRTGGLSSSSQLFSAENQEADFFTRKKHEEKIKFARLRSKSLFLPTSFSGWLSAAALEGTFSELLRQMKSETTNIWRLFLLLRFRD